MDTAYRLRPARLTLAGLACALGPLLAAAQGIATDASLGHTAQTLQGPTYEIPQSLGRLSGANLFHSFARFGLESGERARFTTESAGLANVIARVSGGSVSNIAGAIELAAAAGSTPDLFLINPAGVVFAAGASIEVPGAFLVSTGDSLRFADGTFHADLAKPSQFSSAPPLAFGFLGDHSATLRIEGAALSTGDRPFTAIAGDVAVSAGGVLNRSGELRVVAVGKLAGEVPLELAPAAAAGSVSIGAGGYLASQAGSAAPGGAISVHAGQVRVDGGAAGAAFLSTSALGSAAAGTVSVDATGAVEVLSGGFLGSETLADGPAGAVGVRAASLTMDGGAIGFASIASDSGAGASGPGGGVEIVLAGDAVLSNGASVRSSTFGAGTAGSVNFSARTLRIDGGEASVAGILSNSNRGAEGAGGAVSVVIDGALAISNGGRISSSTLSAAPAGSVSVQAGELDIAGRPDGLTGILSDANLGSDGPAGPVEVAVAGHARITNLGLVSSSTFGSGAAGTVGFRAGSLEIDGGLAGVAGIFSDANGGSRGDGGSLRVEVAGAARLVNGGAVSSSTFSSGKAGDVSFTARELDVDGGAAGFAGIKSSAGPGSSGRAGSVAVTVGAGIRLAAGGQISSSTTGSGDAGAVSVAARSLEIAGSERRFSGVFSDASTDSPGAAGSVRVAVDQLLRLGPAALVQTTTFGGGASGAIEVSAGRLEIDGGTLGSGILSDGMSAVGGVTVRVDGLADLRNAAFVSSSTFGSGRGGSVVLEAGELRMSGAGDRAIASVISIAGRGSSGDGGSVEVRIGGALSLSDGAVISSTTDGLGDAGRVAVHAGTLDIDAGGGFAAITSDATSRSPGAGGSVTVELAGDLHLRNGGSIETSALGSGPAGAIALSADRLFIDNPTEFTAGVLSDANGGAGSIAIRLAGAASLRGNATISSRSFGPGDAGSIVLESSSLSLAGGDGAASIATEAAPGATGAAGSIELAVSGATELRDFGFISSDTYGPGPAGTIRLDTGSLVVEAGETAIAAILSNTFESTGAGGSIDVHAADAIRIGRGGVVSASTLAQGAAGTVALTAPSIDIDAGGQVSARALAGSSGQTGDIAIDAGNLRLAGGSRISIANQARIADAQGLRRSTIRIDAERIEVSEGAEISAAAVGNTAASAIEIVFGERLRVDSAAISTRAVDGDGGPITVSGRGVVVLADAAIGTSVSGLSGNGGDIGVQAGALVLDTGFIQANTAAAQAAGGDVTVSVPQVLASAGQIFVGGSQPFDLGQVLGVAGFNVIQAAAPTGVAGEIRILSNATDVAGSLAELRLPALDLSTFSRDPCSLGRRNTFARGGRGRLPDSPQDFQRARPAAAAPTLPDPEALRTPAAARAPECKPLMGASGARAS